MLCTDLSGDLYTVLFFLIAFFLAAATCLFLLIRKQWKWLAFYSAAMLLAVLSVFCVFPAGITQITGSETNNVGNEIASNILQSYNPFGGSDFTTAYVAFTEKSNG